MKKVLFATTALLAVASMASADVRMSGYGRFGLDYNDANSTSATGNGISSTTITSRLRLQFDMTTESDGGVQFGARFRVQDSNANNNTAATGAVNMARFYASSGGFTLGVGNIWGALDSMAGTYLPTQSGDTGVDGMSYYAYPVLAGHDGYSSGGAGANGVEALYSSGAFGAHISYSANNGVPTGGLTSKRFAGNVSYTFGDWTAAVGFQSSDIVGEDVIAASIEGSLGQFGVGVAYANNKDFAGAGNDVDVIRVYGSVDIGSASKAILWVTNRNYGNVVNTMDGTSFGLHYQMDLGGGVSIQAGAVEAANNNTQVQAGVKFNF